MLLPLAQAGPVESDPTSLSEYGIGFFALAILWVVIREVVGPIVKRKTATDPPAPAASPSGGGGAEVWNLEDRRIQDHETRLRDQELTCAETRTRLTEEVKAIRTDTKAIKRELGGMKKSQEVITAGQASTQDSLNELLTSLATGEEAN